MDGNFGKFPLTKTVNRAKRIIILILNKVVQIWNIKKFSKLGNTLKKLIHPKKLSVSTEHVATFLENYYVPSWKNCLPEQYTLKAR